MRYWAAEMERADALLFGRVTYEMMESAWRRPATGTWPEWMGEWERFCRIIESPTRPLEPRLRYLEAVSKRFGSLEVREYRLKHLAIVHRDAVAGGWAFDEVAMMLAMVLKMSVIDCVRRTQAVFAGHTDADDPGPRKAKRKEASNAKPTRNGRTRT